MSLRDLLNETESNSSLWKDQRRKIFRIFMGVGLVALIGVSVAMLINSHTKKAAKEAQSQETQKQDAESLEKLMTFQNEAKQLQREIDEMNKTAALDKYGTQTDGTYVAQNERVETHPAVRRAPSQQRIIDFDPGEGFTNVKPTSENLYVPTGAVFQARLITPIKTSLQRSLVIAETTNEFRMDMKRRIPKDSRLIGRARLDPVLKGVIVDFDTLVLPGGKETKIDGLALSRNALPEIDGLYFSDKLETYGTALAFGFLSGFSDAARERESTVFGSLPKESVSNQVLAGLSTASFQVADEILRDIRNSAIEYVVVPAGEPIFVALTKRYELNQGDK